MGRYKLMSELRAQSASSLCCVGTSQIQAQVFQLLNISTIHVVYGMLSSLFVYLSSLCTVLSWRHMMAENNDRKVSPTCFKPINKQNVSLYHQNSLVEKILVVLIYRKSKWLCANTLFFLNIDNL